MSNIILTTNCNRRCPYCFAKDNISNPMQFSVENFIRVIDWLEKDNNAIHRIGFLGGEPTTHPNFFDLLSYTLSKKLNTLIFTNGIIEDPNFYKNILDLARGYGVKNSSDLSFLVNVNEKKYRSKDEIYLQDRFLKEFGRVSTLSFNIFEESFDPMFLISLIEQYNLKRNLRIGLAAPIGNSNKYLEVGHYKTVASKIIKLGIETTKHNIILGLDCGFIKCMFSDEELNQLESIKTDKVTFDCCQIIDIYPNLEVSNCYPLSRLKRLNINDFDSLNDMAENFKDSLKNIPHIFNECGDCKFLINKECDGGCKAHKAYV